jgi:hypothetical protein
LPTIRHRQIGDIVWRQNAHVSDVHRHPREIGVAHAVTPLELFFDLVFVFALTQVTTLMADDLTWLGLLRGFAVLAAIWWAWVGFSWLTNSIRIDDVSSRLVMLVTMAIMLVVGLAAPQAFGTYSILFGSAYLAVRLLHLALYAVTTRSDPDVFGASAPAPDGGSPRHPGRFTAGRVARALWALALIDFVTPLIAGPGLCIDAPHFTERHGLIIIIALGESVVALASCCWQPRPPVVAAGRWASSWSPRCGGCTSTWSPWSRSGDWPRSPGGLRRGARSYPTSTRSWFGIVLTAGLKKTLINIGDPLKAVADVALFGGGAHLLPRGIPASQHRLTRNGAPLAVVLRAHHRGVGFPRRSHDDPHRAAGRTGRL